MRISADQHDPGYEAFIASKIRRQRVVVFCDGDSIRNPITADDEAGIVIVYLFDHDGRPIINRLSNSAVQRVIVGKVKIILEDE